MQGLLPCYFRLGVVLQFPCGTPSSIKIFRVLILNQDTLRLIILGHVKEHVSEGRSIHANTIIHTYMVPL